MVVVRSSFGLKLEDQGVKKGIHSFGIKELAKTIPVHPASVGSQTISNHNG